MEKMHLQQIAGYQKFYRGQLLSNVMPFWLKSDMLDKQFGGYTTSVDRYGQSYNTDKSVWFQGRGLWTFSALCRQYGPNEEWLDAARTGKEFLERYCIDTDGRMFFTTTAEGKPLRKRRYLFSESFYVVGMAEYGAMAQDMVAIGKAKSVFDKMILYYNTPQEDPYKITPKTYAENRKERSVAILMVLISSGQILRRCDSGHEAYYSQAISTLIEEMMKYHYKPDMESFLETVTETGGFINNPTGRTMNPGHTCENSWFLMNEAVFTNNAELLRAALSMLDWALMRGWDEQYGGIFYFVDIKNRPCEPLEWDMKLWWVHNEALIACLMAFGITGDEKYWVWFEKIHHYSFSHFADDECGEWFGYLHRDGSVSHTQKGSMWKGPYHLPRCLMICDELLGFMLSGGGIHPVL